MKLHTFNPTTTGECRCGLPRDDWHHGGIPEGKYVPLTDPAVEAAKSVVESRDIQKHAVFHADMGGIP